MRARTWHTQRLPRRLAIAVAAAAMAGLAGGAWAGNGFAHGTAAADAQATSPAVPRRQDGPLSREQAVALAQRRYHARVVRADTRDEGGQRYYVLRLLSEGGRIWTVRVDAQNGQIR